MKKFATIFLAAMYLHLVLSIAVPIGIFYAGNAGDGWSEWMIGLLVFYLLMAVMVHIVGWSCVVAAVLAYRRNEADKLRQSWKLLKLWSIPFYILNFIYSYFVWFILIGASRGLIGILIPIPVIYTGTLIVQSGCVGICYLMLLRKKYQKRPSAIHYVWQLFSVFDVFSTIFVLKKYGEEAN